MAKIASSPTTIIVTPTAETRTANKKRRAKPESAVEGDWVLELSMKALSQIPRDCGMKREKGWWEYFYGPRIVSRSNGPERPRMLLKVSGSKSWRAPWLCVNWRVSERLPTEATKKMVLSEWNLRRGLNLCTEVGRSASVVVCLWPFLWTRPHKCRKDHIHAQIAVISVMGITQRKEIGLMETTDLELLGKISRKNMLLMSSPGSATAEVVRMDKMSRPWF